MGRDRARDEIRRSLRASVEQGIGRWADASPPDSDYGAPVYEYAERGRQLTLFEGGVQEVTQHATVRAAYRDVVSVVTLRLAELVYVSRNPEAVVELVLEREDASLRLPMPLKVYSTVSALLIRLTSPLNSRINR